MTRAKKQEHIESKEEIAQTLKIQGQRTIVKDKLYPALVGATVSIDEAKMLLQSISTLILEDSLRILQEKKVLDIKDRLIKQLCPNGDREKEITALLDTVADETLFDVKAYVEGLQQAIDFMLRKEQQERTLNSITPDWDLMMSK